MAHVETKLEKLNAKNYTTWQIVMTSLLKSKGLWNYCVVKIESNQEDVMMKNEEAKHLIYAAMDAGQIASTGACSTAFDLWVKVKENHEGAEVDLKNNALADFLGFKYSKGETIVQYCGRFENALSRLEATGRAVDESTKIWVFRNSLPKDLKAVVNTWTIARPTGKVTELMSQLKVQFHMDKADESESVALYSRAGNYKKNQKPFNKNGFNGSRANNDRESDTSSDKKMFCTYCKKDNHRWRECRKLAADNKRKKSFASDKQRGYQKPTSEAYMANEIVNSRQPEFDPNTWIIDSGASSHMTPNRHLLDDYMHFDKPRLIYMGDGKPAEAYGQGRMYFTCGKSSGYLSNVLWVPKLRENLFSVGHTLEQGFTVRFVNDPTEVHFYKAGQLKLKGFELRQSMFALKLKKTHCVSEEPHLNAFVGTDIDTWHKRYAHASTDAVKELIKKKAVKGLTICENPKKRCTDCAVAKITRASHPTVERRMATEQSAVLYIDTCGPMSSLSLGGSQYFVLAVEEYSGYKLIDFCRLKSYAPAIVKRMINRVELETKRLVKMIVTDNGTEYCNDNLDDWLDERGIVHNLTTRYTPEQNGMVERSNRTVLEGIRALLHDSKLPDNLWPEAANTIVYATNRLLSARDKTKTRYELYFGRKPDVSNMRVFGEKVIVHNPIRPKKLAPKGEQLIFVGYTERANTYRLYNPERREVVTSCDVIFVQEDKERLSQSNDDTSDEEVITISQPISHDKQSDEQLGVHLETQSNVQQSEQVDNLDTAELSNADPLANSFSNDSDDTIIYYNNGDEHVQELTPNQSNNNDTGSRITRSTTRGNVSRLWRDLSTPGWFWNRNSDSDQNQSTRESALFTLDDEPRTLADAKARPDWNLWKQAMNEELDALNKNNTWVLVDKPSNVKPIKCKWVFKVKLTPQGMIERYKARLVAKGYSQIQNVDYKETFAPVASMNTIRILFAIANQNDMDILQFDVKTAFLYGDLDETIYMDFPEGYDNPDNKVCLLKRSLYGLKQAPRQWNKKFDSFLKQFNLQQSQIDKCMYFNDKRSLLLTIYVDDGLVASRDKILLKNLIKYLQENFQLKTMECESYLGFQVRRDRKKKRTYLLQTHFIDKILERFGMKDCNPISTPEEVGAKFDQSDVDEILSDEYPFKELVGCLLYLVTCTRPDLAHAVSMASRTAKPTMVHWKLLKRILRYLRDSRNLGICFRWEENPVLVGFSDADYANDVETRRSTTGFIIMYGGTPIAWRCQRQSIVALSTTEAEYISGCELVKELLPIRQLMLETKQIRDEPTTVYIDNQSTVRIVNNEAGQQRTKHIDVREKWLTEQHEAGKITVKHVSGDKQAADILTKPLHKSKFMSNRAMLLTALVMCALVCQVASYTFVRTGPIFFKPTTRPFVDGDGEYKLRLVFVNPCEAFFNHTVESSEENMFLIKTCFDTFEKKLVNRLSECTRGRDIGGNLTDVPDAPACSLIGCPHLHQNKKMITSDLGRVFPPNQPPLVPVADNSSMQIRRSKRAVPLLYIGGMIILTGMSSYGVVVSTKNAENIDVMAKVRDKERELLDDGVALLTQFKENIHALNNWNAETDVILSRLQMDALYKPKVAALINHFQGTFSDDSAFLDKLNQALKYDRVPPDLAVLGQNISALWKEPGSEWSSVDSCDYHLENKSLVVDLHFYVPLVNDSIKIMEAVPLNFFNATQESAGKPTICWMRYKGPRQILVNTTNHCMAEIYEAEDNGPVRAQTCVTKDDQLKPMENLWEPERCLDKPIPNKRIIQDREYGGLHKVYCYLYNITIEKEPTRPCPDYVFEMEGKTSYRIGDMEHYGFFADRTIIRSYDIHLGKEILAQLKTDRIKYRALNLTGMDVAYDTYVSKLRQIPHKLNITNPTLISFIETPLKWIDMATSTLMSYVKTAGIVMGAIAGGFVLILIAPVIELVVILFRILSIPVGIWRNSAKRLVGKMQDLLRRKGLVASAPKRKYWEPPYKMA